MLIIIISTYFKILHLEQVKSSNGEEPMFFFLLNIIISYFLLKNKGLLPLFNAVAISGQWGKKIKVRAFPT